MARLIREQVTVSSVAGKPNSFVWRQKPYSVVACIDDWRDTGEWWEGETPKDFWRVRTTTGGLYDLFLEPTSGQWWLYKIND